jgi:hypothetical protein
LRLLHLFVSFFLTVKSLQFALLSDNIVFEFSQHILEVLTVVILLFAQLFELFRLITLLLHQLLLVDHLEPVSGTLGFLVHFLDGVQFFLEFVEESFYGLFVLLVELVDFIFVLFLRTLLEEFQISILSFLVIKLLLI